MGAARGNHFGRRGNAVHVADGREQRRIAREAHDLGLHLEVFAGIAQHADFADFDRRHDGADDGAYDLGHAPLDLQHGRVVERELHHLGNVVELAQRTHAGFDAGAHTRLPSTFWKAFSSAAIWPSMLASTRPISLSRMQACGASRPSARMSR